MGTIVIPSGYAWSTWTLSNLDNHTNHIDVTAGQTSGTATSPAAGYDAGSGYAWRKIDWWTVYVKGILAEARTATTSAGLTSASWFTIYDDCLFVSANQKRFIQFRFTLTITDSVNPELYTATATYESTTAVVDKGFNYSLDGARPTKDGVYKGRRYICAVCGLSGRKRELTWQRGALVHRSTCYDEIPKKGR